MEISRYLAMTGQEMAACPSLPQGLAYIACHFSPYTTGLTDCPEALPPGAMLTVNDATPVAGQDPEAVAEQLAQWVKALGVARVLLDFQRPGIPLTEKICRAACQKLSCPVGVSHHYAKSLSCPVLLPPIAPDQWAPRVLGLWEGREIWLEVTAIPIEITITGEGARVREASGGIPLPHPHEEKDLHCSYRGWQEEGRVVFRLWRTKEQEEALLLQASSLGVTTAIRLYQELAHEKKLPAKMAGSFEQQQDEGY